MTTKALGAATVLAACGAVSATTVKPMHFSEVVKAAEYIFVGTATKSVSYWEDNRTTIRTYLTFSDLQVKKGTISGQSFTVRYDGGKVGDTTIWMAEFPKFQIGKRYLLYIRGNYKYGSPIVGFSQGAFEVSGVGGRQALKNMEGRPLIGIKDDRFVFLGKARPAVKGGVVTDPNFKPVPARPNVDEIERKMLERWKRGEVNRLPVELPSKVPAGAKPKPLPPDIAGDAGPPKVSNKPVTEEPKRNADPIYVDPAKDNGDRLSLSSMLDKTRRIR